MSSGGCLLNTCLGDDEMKAGGRVYKEQRDQYVVVLKQAAVASASSEVCCEGASSLGFTFTASDDPSPSGVG